MGEFSALELLRNSLHHSFQGHPDGEFKLEEIKGGKEKTISISALLTMPKTLTVWITINCGKF